MLQKNRCCLGVSNAVLHSSQLRRISSSDCIGQLAQQQSQAASTKCMDCTTYSNCVQHSNMWTARVAGQQHLQQVTVLWVCLRPGCSHCQAEQLSCFHTVYSPQQLLQLCRQTLLPHTMTELQPDWTLHYIVCANRISRAAAACCAVAASSWYNV